METPDQSHRKIEQTPSGSEIILAKAKNIAEMFGFIPTFAKEREKIYEAMFGNAETVSHELLPLVPHIDVYIYPPGTDNRNFYTLVSGGMSDVLMNLPKEVDDSLARREIILYCNEPKEEYIDWVRFFARYPSRYETWLGHGHTMPNGDPPEAILEGSELMGFVLLYTILEPDNQLGQSLIIEGNPVEFLWLIPLTQAEMDFKLEQGIDELLSVFESVNHPVVLNPMRKSYL